MKASSVASDYGFPETVEHLDQGLVECRPEEEGKGNVARPVRSGVHAGPRHEQGDEEQPASDRRSKAKGHPGEGHHVEGVRGGEGTSFGRAIGSGRRRFFDHWRQENTEDCSSGVVEGNGAHVFMGLVGARALGEAFEGVGDGVVVEQDDGCGEDEPDSALGSSDQGDNESHSAEHGFPDREVGEHRHASVQSGVDPLLVEELKKHLLHGERVGISPYA